MSESFPPPLYSRTDPGGSYLASSDGTQEDPQILIVPTGNDVNFQQGFLGVDGENAAIEGELQIKGSGNERWSKISITLRTIETADDLEIELGSSRVILFSADSGSGSCTSSLPFSVPLTSDTPQGIRTPSSSLSHLLTATLFPLNDSLPISRTLTVHTRRYTSRTHSLPTTPETFTISQPSYVEVEVPRTSFKAGEAIPLYVTVPPPLREVVVEEGLRLRNIRVELERVIKIRHSLEQSRQIENAEEHVSTTDKPSKSASETLSRPSSSTAILSSGPDSDTIHRTTVARSGASCRFHSSRPVKMRFVLQQSGCSPSDTTISLPNGEPGPQDSNSECPSITQHTILHSVTFRLIVNIAFLDVVFRRERVSTVSIPMTIIPPSAPLPEILSDIDTAYSKKHDRPPAATVRLDDAENSVPHYSEGEAGPSALPPTSAPPPFEEQDAPPPFWSNDPQSSTSRLPSFLESESEIILPDLPELLRFPLSGFIYPGEGTEFGFLACEQFDGHSESPQRESSPPPPLEMASRDTDLTSLADLSEPHLAMGVMSLVIDGDHVSMDAPPPSTPPPPPPPAMDDPLDPPPSIDSEFRTSEIGLQPSLATSASHTSVSLALSSAELLSTTSTVQPVSIDSHAPPPYLNPHAHQDNVPRPPPYVD